MVIEVFLDSWLKSLTGKKHNEQSSPSIYLFAIIVCLAAQNNFHYDMMLRMHGYSLSMVVTSSTISPSQPS